MNEEIEKERQRIWQELLKALPIDDYGNLIQEDEIYNIIFNKNKHES